MKLLITQGATSQRCVVFVQNGSSTTGGGLTGLTSASSGLIWYWYSSASGTSTAVSIVGQTLGTWTSGGFVEIDSAHLPGFYEIGVPNACFASSPTWAVMQLSGAASMVPVNVEFETPAFNLTTATQPVNVIQFGGTAGTFTSGVPNVNATVVGTPAVNVTQFGGTNGTFTSGVPNVNASITGTMSANVVQWLGTAVTAATGGIPDVNTKNYNNVAAQTDANNLPKIDLVDIAGVAVSTTSPQLGVNVVQYNAHTAATDANNLPKVDVEDFGGTTGTFTAGQPNVIAAGGTISGDVNVTQWLGTAVAATVGGYPDVNVKYFGGTLGTYTSGLPNVNANLIGTPAVNVTEFGGTNGTFTSGLPNVNANLIGIPAVNVTEFGGTAGTFTSGVPNANATVSGTFAANVVEWAGSAVSNVNVAGVPVVDVGLFGGHAITFSGTFPEVAIATNLDKTGYSIAAGQITVKKNTALAGFTFPMFSSTAPSSLASGLSVTAARSIDGGGMAGTTNAVSAVGSGVYKIDLAAADLNGNSITFIFTASGALDASITIVTQP